MDWTVEYDTERDYLHVEVGGRFTLAEHERMVADILGRPEWRPGLRVLFDRRRSIWSEADSEAMRQAVAVHEEHDDEIGPGRAAIVMAPGVGFGLGRQFAQLGEPRVSAQLGIFTDLDEALDWLLAAPPTGAPATGGESVA